MLMVCMRCCHAQFDIGSPAVQVVAKKVHRLLLVKIYGWRLDMGHFTPLLSDGGSTLASQATGDGWHWHRHRSLALGASVRLAVCCSVNHESESV
jgi:hypothetical protein